MERFSNANAILAFVTVAREGSVSRAADLLNLTQPAISHQIKRLGEEMGLKLFTRTPTGLKLSQDGAAVLPQAEQVISALRDFNGSAQQRASQLSGKLTLGTIIDPEFIRLGRFLALLRKEHTNIETELVHGVSGDVLNWLRKSQIDAGFFLCGEEDVSCLQDDEQTPVHAVKLADFHYRVIGPVGWDNQVENASWQQLAKLPWLGTPPSSSHHQLLKSVAVEEGIELNVVARVDQESSMLEMVKSGIGLSLCRDSIALHEKQSYGLSVANTVSVPACLCFIVSENSRQTPLITEILNLVERSW